MKRFMLACLTIGLLLIGATLLRTTTRAEANETGSFFDEEPVPEPVPREPPDLRQQYLEVMQRRAELMSDVELRQAIDEARKVIDEDAAGKALKTVVDKCLDQLEEIIKRHPETEASARAKRVRDAIATGMSGSPPRRSLMFN